MSVISVTVGAALAAQTGSFNWGLYVLVLAGIIFFHAATNMINDYYDWKRGIDKPEAPTAKYRPHPLIEGFLTPRQIFWGSVVLYFLVLALGLYLTILKGPALLIIGFIGFLASFFYTAYPVGYKYYALGELSVFFMWGPLMVLGSYLVQTAAFSAEPIFVSLPLGILVALVLLADNLRDIRYDSQLGVKTIGILLGERATLQLYYALMASAYLITILLVAFGVLDLWGLLILLSLPIAFKLARVFKVEVPKDADARTAQLNMVFGILLIIALILERVFSFP